MGDRILAQYRIRLAGATAGEPMIDVEVDAEVQHVRKVLLKAGTPHICPDVHYGLKAMTLQSRLLLLEKLTAKGWEIAGFVGWEIRDIVNQRYGKSMQHAFRGVMIRGLVVLPCDGRRFLARRLCREAQLRGTVRGFRSGDVHIQVCGAFAAIEEDNRAALIWTEAQVGAVLLLAPDSPETSSDEALRKLVVDLGDQAREMKRGEFRIAIINRIGLIEAARLHQVGRVSGRTAHPEECYSVEYDPFDPMQAELEIIVSGLAAAAPSPMLLRRYGLLGDPDETVWGPPMASDMATCWDPHLSQSC